jgi:hypothetical protein
MGLPRPPGSPIALPATVAGQGRVDRRPAQPPQVASATSEAPKSRPPTQDRTTDRRTYEDRNLEELRERARELDIEGRSAMTKDELIAALREQAK